MSRFRPVLSCVFALALCIPVAARAWESDDNDSDTSWDHPSDDPDHVCPDCGPADSAVVQEKLATKFGVEESQIANLRDENLGYGEIDHTLTLAERLPGGITDENVNTILAMRQDQHMGWGQIAKAQDTTLGAAKHERSVTTHPDDPSTVQPTSLSRTGKSTTGTARGSSTGGHAGKSSASLGSSSHSGRAVASSARPAPSGHAYGRGSAGGSSASANGKAKGHK